MDKLYWLATAVAAMSVGIANAQLAQVDNDTMPTSMFMTVSSSWALYTGPALIYHVATTIATPIEIRAAISSPLSVILGLK